MFTRSRDDGRVTWPTPALEEDRVYIGTTDDEYTGDLDRVEPTEQEIQYLLNVANHTIPDAGLGFDDVVGSWSGVRPLVAPAPGTPVGNASRDHKVETGPGGMVTISGGKLTNNRVMAKDVVDSVARQLGLPPTTYLAGKVPTSGGNAVGIERARARLTASDVPEHLAQRWLSHYGANATSLLDLWTADSANQAMVGPRDLSVAEVTYAVRNEFTRSLEDLMVRRTSLFFWDHEGGLGHIDAISTLLAQLLGWDEAERRRQVDAYADLVRRHRPGRATEKGST